MAQNKKIFSFHMLSAMLIFFYGCHNPHEDATENTEVKTRVTVVHPSYQKMAEYIQLNGVTLLQKKDNIRSTNTGYITSMKFKQGDFIESGQLFCTLGTKEQQALKNISSLDSSLNKFQKPLPVIANTSGIITAISALQGDYVSEGDVLANVSEPSSLIVQVNVPYEDNQFVKAGKPCEIILPDGKVINAAITGAMPTVDAASQSQTFFIRLPGESLPENLNVAIRISKQQKSNLLCVPTAAVQTDEMQKEFWVMKIVKDSLAIKVPVQTGLQNDSMTEIISDKISVADNIISEGAFALADSSFVIFNK
jgi:multidrug efflux pump subunit AcrA (membrane-fusion protein)